MQWQYDKQGNCTGDVVVSYPRFEAMKELCSQIVEYVLPHNREVKWEFLRFEVWADSGQVVVFPSVHVELYRIEKVACQLVFDELSQWFADLEPSLSEHEVTRCIDQKEREWGDLFLVAAAASKLRGLRVVVFSPGGELLRSGPAPNFREMNLEGINFDDADLTEAVVGQPISGELLWSQPDAGKLQAADLRANLNELLRYATLRGANLGRDNLNGATHLDGADLRGADLGGTLDERASARTIRR